MFELLAAIWLCGAVAILVLAGLARRRRSLLARELHELRGALTAARLAVDLFPEGGEREVTAGSAARDELARSSASLGDFERLLHAPLAPSPLANRASDGERRLRAEHCDPREELRCLGLIWGEAARRQDRKLCLRWEGPGGDVRLFGPRRRFVEVIANLLANAVRHGGGRITLEARMRSDHLRVEVADEGSGLPARAGAPEHPLKRISLRVRRHGHGLTIARRAAAALGGDLHSAPTAQGTRWVLRVPALHDPTFRVFDDEPRPARHLRPAADLRSAE